MTTRAPAVLKIGDKSDCYHKEQEKAEQSVEMFSWKLLNSSSPKTLRAVTGSLEASPQNISCVIQPFPGSYMHAIQF